MNKNAKKWVNALKSGEFKRATGSLRDKDKHNNPTYCCLGVACVIYQRETDDPVPELLTDNYLPERVQKWLGLVDDAGGMDDPGSLTDKNDTDRMTFKRIARLIESEPKGLFAKD